MATNLRKPKPPGPIAHGQLINASNTGRAGAAAARITGYRESMTTIAGNQSYSTSQTFDNVRFTGLVDVTGGTVTFNFCLFDVQPVATYRSALRQYDAGNDCGVVKCNWCTFDSGLRGAQGVTESGGFQAGERGPSNPATSGVASKFDLYRCSIQGYGNGIVLDRFLTTQPSTIAECFIGNLTSGASTHVDGIEYYSSNNIRVERCRITSTVGGGGAALNVSPDEIDFPSPGNPILIRDNYVNGGNFVVICGDNLAALSDVVPNCSFTGNYFGDESEWGQTVDMAGNDATYNQAYHAANLNVVYWAQSNVWAPNGEGVSNLPIDSKGLPHVGAAFVSAANFGAGGTWTWDGEVLDFSSNVPVVTPASFTQMTNGLDVLIGHVDATNTPTSYAIVSGNPNGYFAIYASGNLRTSDTIPAPSGIYTLQITATNADGTSDPATFNVTLATHLAVSSLSSVAGLVASAYIPSPYISASLAAGGGLAAVVEILGKVFASAALNAGGALSCNATVVAGEGYDNLANWPSAANRPAWNSGTSTLSWIGPTGGGASTASDDSQSLELDDPGSYVTSTSNNQVIEGLNIDYGRNAGYQYGTLTINHDNVTIRRCRIRNPHGAGASGSSPVIALNGTNCIIEDCIIDGASTTSTPNNAQNGIHFNGSGPWIVRRCNILNLENHLRTCSDATFIDNWIHGAAGSDADMVELYGGSSDIVVQHNTFDGSDVHAGCYLNSSINLTDYLGSVTNIDMVNNAFIEGGALWTINDDDDQGGGTITQCSATNNGFYSVPSYRRNGITLSPNSGNFIMATTSATSGSATNGTGAI